MGTDHRPVEVGVMVGLLTEKKTQNYDDFGPHSLVRSGNDLVLFQS